MESCSEQLEGEAGAYDRAAASEEERTLLLSNVLAMSSEMDDIHDDEDGTIRGVIDSFQQELDALADACDEQAAELRLLQNLMRDQRDRSDAISDREDIAFHELNALEIEARNFSEESHLVGSSCSAIESEIEDMARVRLLSVPFDVRADRGSGGGGRYPTINGLRLAYRPNEGAGLGREEIDAAFAGAARLVAHALGLHPDLLRAAARAIRIIPLCPRAKILVSLPEGQSVHELGVDAASGRVPSRSIALFLVILSQLSSHVIAGAERGKAGTAAAAPPPFPMTESSIDGVDLAGLADGHPAWPSVVFCVAANLRWLSGLEAGRDRA